VTALDSPLNDSRDAFRLNVKADIDRAARENAELAAALQRAWERGDVEQAKWLLERQVQKVTTLQLNLFTPEAP
jgi:hypothetical protein